MERNYIDGVSTSATLFVGTEVEHTPAYGMKTLFVVGIHNPTEIHSAAVAYECDHIYFGANQSFPLLDVNDAEGWHPWEDMIFTMLKSSRTLGTPYFCTLDMDVSCVEGLAESGFCEYHNFIPMISVKLPYLQLLNYNATLKLDDKDFNATNPGVWCHSIHKLKDRSLFTDWSKYSQDTIIKGQ